MSEDSRTPIDTITASLERALAETTGAASLRPLVERLVESWNALDQQLKMQELVAAISDRLVSLPHDQLERGIVHALSELGTATRVHRAYVFLRSEDGRQIEDIYAWYASGVGAEELASLRGRSAEHFGWTLAQLERGLAVEVEDVDALPPEAEAERAACEAHNIRSYVNAPLRATGELMGWLGYDSVDRTRKWSTHELALMRVSAEHLAQALFRKRRDERLFHERELTRRVASLGTLAAGVAHEMNNPLAYASANLQFLRESLADESSARSDWLEAIDEAIEGVTRTTAIVSDLHTFVADSKRDIGPTDLVDVLETSIRMTESQIRHRATLVRELSALPTVRGTRSKLTQVFVNLLTNAAKAIPLDDGRPHQVRVRGRREGDWVAVSITDTGCGMDPSTVSRIFDPFYSGRAVDDGIGLGLSISHNIVTAFDGRIEVRSHPGEGSTFVVHLRVAEAVSASVTPAPVSQRPTARRRVLMVDDEENLLRAMKRLLREHDVVTVTSGTAALESLRSETFDLVLCDVTMPEMSGVEFYRQVERMGMGLEERLVFLTGGVFEEEVRTFLAALPNPTLHKPIDATAIRRLVAEPWYLNARDDTSGES